MAVRPELAWTVTDHVGHAHSLLLNVAAKVFVDEDVSVPEFVALAILSEVGQDGLSQTEWGRFQGVSRQRAHVVTKTLAASGLVLVRRHGRSSTIRLSKKGERFVAKWKPALSKALATQFAGLNAKEAQTLLRLLQKLVAADV